MLRGRLLMECLRLPRRESLVKCALAQCTLLDRDGGAALVGLDQRHVEPGALLQELDVAGAIDLGVGQADEKDAIGYLGGEPCESLATSGARGRLGRASGSMQQYSQALPDGVNSVTGTLGSEVIAAGEGVEPLFLVSGIPRGVQTLLGLLSAAHEFCHRCPHC